MLKTLRRALGLLLLAGTVTLAAAAEYNILDHGAVCNGTTDDATAFANTIAAVPAAGGDIRVPVGICLIGSTQTLNGKIRVMGYGAQDTPENQTGATILLKKSTLNGPLFLVTAPNVVIQDLVIDGQTSNGGDGIDIQAPLVTVSNVSVFHQGQDGIRVGKDGVNQSVNHCRMDTVVSSFNGRHGIFIKYNSTTSINANACTMVHILAMENAYDGLRFENALFNTVVGGGFHQNGRYGLAFGAYASHNRILGVDIQEENGTQDIIFEGNTSCSNDVHASIQSESRITDSCTSYSNYVVFQQSGGGGEWLHGVYALDLSGTGTGYLRNSKTNGGINVIVENETNSNANSVLNITKYGLQVGSQSFRATNSAPIKGIPRGTSSLSWSAITTGSSAYQDVTVTGAVSGNNCICTPAGDPGSSLVWSSLAVTDACRLKIVNPSSGSVTPSTYNWNCIAIKY